MSPLSKDIKKNALPAAAALLFFCGAFLNGCGSDGKASRPVEAYEGGTASVALEISGEEPPGIDSLVITAEGPDSLRITKTALGETAEFSLRPAETWKITASSLSLMKNAFSIAGCVPSVFSDAAANWMSSRYPALSSARRLRIFMLAESAAPVL